MEVHAKEEIKALKTENEELKQKLQIAEAIIKWCITKLCKTEASLGKTRRAIGKSVVQMNGFSFADVMGFIDPPLKKIFAGKEKEEE